MGDLLSSIGGYTRCVTEFVRVSQTTLPKEVCLRSTPELAQNSLTNHVTPVYLQLLGSGPELMAGNAAKAAALGALGINLNFGCPAKTVNRSDGGAKLLREPSQAASICKMVRNRVAKNVPVTAKISLGFESVIDFPQILDAFEEVGLSEITIHTRTRSQGNQLPAHWHLLKAAQERLPYPVIANGELRTPLDVKRCAELSGCTAFMLARGALCRPDLAHATNSAFIGDHVSPFDWSSVQMFLIKFLGENRARHLNRFSLNPVKQWLVYLKLKYPQVGVLFNKVKRIADPEEMDSILQTFRLPDAASLG